MQLRKAVWSRTVPLRSLRLGPLTTSGWRLFKRFGATSNSLRGSDDRQSSIGRGGQSHVRLHRASHLQHPPLSFRGGRVGWLGMYGSEPVEEERGPAAAESGRPAGPEQRVTM